MDVLGERLRAQLLSGPPASRPVDVVEQLLAVQAQDSVAARLGIRARSTGLTATDVNRALDDRELVVSWLNRGTLRGRNVRLDPFGPLAASDVDSLNQEAADVERFLAG